ncbi:MAG: alpha/beta hydrolase [Caldilineaceae bacterium]
MSNAIDQVLRPALAPQYQVSMETLVYGQGDVFVGGVPTPKDLLLDLYQPVDTPPGLRPVVMAIHGGGFFRESRANPGIVAIATALAARGYVVVSVEYRMAFDNPVPSARVRDLVALISPLDLSQFAAMLKIPEEQYEAAAASAMDDALTALGWLSDQAQTRLLDMSHLTVLGASAGAVTTLYTVYNANNFGLNVPSAAAVIDLWGGFMFSQDASTVEAGEPPLFIVHGTNDTTFPIAAAEAVVARAQAVGVYYEFYPLAGYGHGFASIDLMTVQVDGQTLFERLVRFLDKVLF